MHLNGALPIAFPPPWFVAESNVRARDAPSLENRAMSNCGDGGSWTESMMVKVFPLEKETAYSRAEGPDRVTLIA